MRRWGASRRSMGRSMNWSRWLDRLRLGSLLDGFRFSGALQDVSNFFGDVDGDRAGVGFLFGNTKAGQKVDDGFGLDLQLAGELVDANLGRVSHTSLGTLLFLLLIGSVLLRMVSRRGVGLRGGLRIVAFACRVLGFLVLSL